MVVGPFAGSRTDRYPTVWVRKPPREHKRAMCPKAWELAASEAGPPRLVAPLVEGDAVAAVAFDARERRGAQALGR